MLGNAVGCISLADYERVKRRAETAEKINKDITQKAEELEARYEDLRAKLRSYSDMKSELAQKDQEIAELRAALKEAVGRGYAQVFPWKGTPGGFSVNPATGGVILDSDAVVLFASGQAGIRKEFESKLQKLADEIRKKDPDGEALIFVDGYTDRQPVVKTKKQNPDNWFLGARRAHAVMRFLRDSCGFPQERFVITSWGYLNEIEKGKIKSSKNRRVEIRLVKGLGAEVPPK